MTVTLAQVEAWLLVKETEHLEFKEAKTTFSFEDVKRYVVALGNEGGGHLVLGISPKIPRRVVGSRAYHDVGELRRRLYDTFRRVFDVEEVTHPQGRVVVLHIPSRPVATPLNLDGAYLVRVGESVVPMGPQRLKAILDEASPDHSAECKPGITLKDLDDGAVARLLDRWAKRTGDDSKRNVGPAQALADLGLSRDGAITNAALVLLGTAAALQRHLADAEIIYEYRLTEGIQHTQRVEWRAGFLSTMDEVWGAVSARNDMQHFQEEFFMRDVPTMREDMVREAVLNAVCHRDYRQVGSTFVKQWPDRLEITSPGGLPPNVTVENIVIQQNPRNRLLAEVLQKIGLVERAGQGMDMIFRRCIEDGKLPPDFLGTDAFTVVIRLHGTVQDHRFIRYLDKVGQQTLATFSALDFMVLDHVRRGLTLPGYCKEREARLVHLEVLERTGRGKVILCRDLYHALGERGTYTRQKGLDRETKKLLLEKHIRSVGVDGGAGLGELCQVLGARVEPRQVQLLLRLLKAEGRVRVTGTTRWAKWLPGVETKIGRD